jgi:hypothetical protein
VCVRAFGSVTALLVFFSRPLLCVSCAQRGAVRHRSYDEVEIKDMALGDYLAVKQKHKYMQVCLFCVRRGGGSNLTHSQFLPHSSGRFCAKRFRKAHCPIVVWERCWCCFLSLCCW